MSELLKYKELSAFNETTVLVECDKKVYVKKRVSKDVMPTYEKLKGKSHKNVCKIHEVFEFADCCVVIEEYIQGESLANILSNKKTLFESETKKTVADICDGLSFLHRQNIIHRDINPNNIIINSDGTAKIIDFGISRSVKKNAACDTEVLGTVGYAAPEQFGFSQSDARTDIYALGVLANVMLTGELPNKRLYEKRLGRVIKKALSADPKSRYQSIHAFKHSFTNETDENTPPVIRLLRRVPGFRTKRAWKMALALIAYGTYIPIIIMFLCWSAVSVNTFLCMTIAVIAVFAVPYVFLTNTADIQKKISSKKAAAIAVSCAISAVSFFAGAVLLSYILEKILV